MATLASDYYPEAILKEPCGITANIYRCKGQKGEYFMTSFNRFFEYNGKTYHTDLFRHEHLIPLSHLARRAYAHIQKLETSETHENNS